MGSLRGFGHVPEQVVTLTAKFADLHHVAQAVAQHISARTGIADVRVGVPQESPNATSEPVLRISLLYATQTSAPRNEPMPRGIGMLPGPLHLSCFYMVTTQGGDSDDPGAAHSALGQVIRLLHEWPVLQLPMSVHGTSHDETPVRLGEGQLRLMQIALTAEYVTQIWLALRQPLQPCTVIEAGPIQLTDPNPAQPTSRHTW